MKKNPGGHNVEALTNRALAILSGVIGGALWVVVWLVFWGIPLRDAIPEMNYRIKAARIAEQQQCRVQPPATCPIRITIPEEEERKYRFMFDLGILGVPLLCLAGYVWFVFGKRRVPPQS